MSEHRLNSAVCIKNDDPPYGYGFLKNQIYFYYKNSNDSFFVLKNDIHCAYDKNYFNEYFIDIKECRKIKLKLIYGKE